MELNEYLADPCRASSLPYWKAERFPVPQNVIVLRDDEYAAAPPGGRDERYFKLMHDLKAVPEPRMPNGFALVPCGTRGFARHIQHCYDRERVSEEELESYKLRPVYREDLWIAVADAESGGLAATGIAESDARIGEGILEWIQVSPGYRRRGLGTFVVCELLRRMRGRAQFATVSGRVNGAGGPYALYTSCGFSHPVIWHVISH